MSDYTRTEFKDGNVLWARQLNKMDTQIEINSKKNNELSNQISQINVYTYGFSFDSTNNKLNIQKSKNGSPDGTVVVDLSPLKTTTSGSGNVDVAAAIANYFTQHPIQDTNTTYSFSVDNGNKKIIIRDNNNNDLSVNLSTMLSGLGSSGSSSD